MFVIKALMFVKRAFCPKGKCEVFCSKMLSGIIFTIYIVLTETKCDQAFGKILSKKERSIKLLKKS